MSISPDSRPTSGRRVPKSACFRPFAEPEVSHGKERHRAIFMTPTPGISAAPFWQEGRVPTLPSDPLPTEVDALIVGGGYTGLSAARETAGGGPTPLGA